jgi:hypothetical protein
MLLPSMLTLYVAALILGLGLLAVQLFASGEASADADAGAALPPDALLPADAVVGSAALDTAEGGPLAHPGGAHGFGWASMFLSLRFHMFAALGFGLVGAPVEALGLSSPGLTFVVALLTGLGVGVAASAAFRWLGRETLSSGATAAELIGQLGRVLVACGKGRTGKVRLTVRGQTLDLLASTDEASIEAGRGIIIQEVYGDRVHVCSAPSELLPE